MSESPIMSHGDVCWDELMTTDPEAAGKFYTELCGWNVQAVPMPDMEYSLCHNNDAMIAGVMGMPPMVPEGTPSHWGSYIYVDNVDEAHTKATGLGAQSVVPPNDIPGVGRFAMMADPVGAMFSVMGPSEEVPASEGPLRDTAANGSFAWHEMMSPDAEATKKFYTALFGWTVLEMPTATPDGGSFTYIILQNGEKHTCGVVQMSDEEQKMGIPPHWGRYIRFENADEALKKVEELGGKKAHDAFDIPNWGRIAFAMDPTGAAFGVFQGLDGH